MVPRFVRTPTQNICGCVREEREANMGSSSSSYAPKTIYLDVDGKVQKVSLILNICIINITDPFFIGLTQNLYPVSVTQVFIILSILG